MKKSLKIIPILLVLALAAVTLLFGCEPEPEETETDDRRLLRAEGNDLVNEDGEVVLLKAINAGGLFVQEGWMCPTLLTDTEGVGVPDHTTMLEVLESRFGYDGMRALIDIYESNFWKEADFDNVKALGFNAIRLPFAYFNLENEAGELTEFSRMDWFIDECDKRDIYVILDLHGAYGSQNGQDHSGDVSGAGLYSDTENMDKTVALWETVAARYASRDIIAGYDLLNEPEGEWGYTNVVQWAFYDKLYEAVRAVDPNHVLIMESVWEARDLPVPSMYPFEWENVCYSYHNYCWDGVYDFDVQKAFVDNKLASYEALSYEVPKFIGEFSCFALADAWEYTLNAYAGAGISYAIWTYKTTGGLAHVGWSAYLKITPDSEKADVENDSYDEIAAKWSVLGTENFRKTAIYEEFI